MNMSKNMVLWVALAIPVLMVLVVAGSIYLPMSGAEPPQYDFIYALRNYSDGYEYSVVDGRLVADVIHREGATKDVPAGVASAPTRFFRQDVAANTSQELSLADVQKLKIDNTIPSPDGYALKRGGQGGGVFPFFFFEGNYNDQYLVKGTASFKMDLKEISEPYFAPTQFIGWVIE